MAKDREKKMKYIVFVGNHKTFSALRLGVRLAQVLAWNGNDVILAGAKGKVPHYTGLKTIEFSPSATIKKLTDTFVKEGVEKVISFVSLPACEAAAGGKIPYLYCEPENFKEDKAVRTKKTILKKAKKVVVLAQTEKPLDKKIYGANAVRVSNPAVWVEHFNHHRPDCFKKENNILAFGKLTKSGGFDVLLKTWARLAPAHTSWHLTIVGDGLSKTSLNKFIEKNHLSGSTQIVPASSDIYSLMRNADIYVNPAREAQGTEDILDAMASKLPVLVTDVAGVDELVVNGVNGLIVNAAEEEPLTIALDELMVNWGKRVGLAVEASRLKERYPLEVFVAFFEQD